MTLAFKTLNKKSLPFRYIPPIVYEDNKINIFTNLSKKDISRTEEEKRYVAYEILTKKNLKKINLIAIHFPDKRNWSMASQNSHSNKLSRFIQEVEEKHENFNTVVLGDFNMNPFQAGMVQANGLHAIMDKTKALKMNRKIEDETYPFFYNPMWSFFGEQGKGDVNGTYYYSKSEDLCYFWNILDQVIIRPSLIQYFNENHLRIITQIGKTSLLTSKGLINREYSDHLPVVFNLNL